MTIAPCRTHRGNPAARCTCDQCGAGVDLVVKHQRDSRHGAEAHAMRKLTAMGWACHGKTLRCPDCEALRRLEAHNHQSKEEPMTTKPATAKLADVMPTELRRPTPAQKRQIIGLLEEVYDDKLLRYAGGETDKTVAEAIGGNVMPGWVAEIREELFGPDGANEDIAILQASLDEMARHGAALAEVNRKQAEDITSLRAKVKESADRLEAIKRAVGPKAAKV